MLKVSISFTICSPWYNANLTKLLATGSSCNQWTSRVTLKNKNKVTHWFVCHVSFWRDWVKPGICLISMVHLDQFDCKLDTRNSWYSSSLSLVIGTFGQLGWEHSGLNKINHPYPTCTSQSIFIYSTEIVRFYHIASPSITCTTVIIELNAVLVWFHQNICSYQHIWSIC